MAPSLVPWLFMAQPQDIPRGTLYEEDWTMTTDEPVSLAKLAGVTGDFVMTDAILQVRTNGASIGTKNQQSMQMAAGVIQPFDYLPMTDTFVKNTTPGSNAVFTVFGFMGPRRVA